jgi:hypothetical protein
MVGGLRGGGLRGTSPGVRHRIHEKLNKGKNTESKPVYKANPHYAHNSHKKSKRSNANSSDSENVFSGLWTSFMNIFRKKE